jgi:alpha-beta hydrolase superfamily lysophospholipase
MNWASSTNSKHTLSLYVVLSAATCALGSASEVNLRTAHCAGVEQGYLEYSPDKDRPLPVVMLLHGAGDRPANMIDAWKGLAKKEKIVLLAPDLPRDPKFEDAAPRTFRCVVDDARHFAAIDPQRVYLFGNSMGGYLAFDGAMFESQYFAAVAVHANRIADEYTGIVGHARRKTPIAIYIGDQDQFFSEQSVRKTRDLLLKAGFPVHYVELPNHDHNYYASADEINADAWKFLAKNGLPD